MRGLTVWRWTEYKWDEEQTGFILICMCISTGHIMGSRAFCFHHTSTLLPAVTAEPVNMAKKCFYVCATRASLWMGNHGDELWPVLVLNRSGCVQQYVCHPLVPPFCVYEEILGVLDHKHVHLFARCVAFSLNAVFPYCITAFWDCRRMTAYLFRQSGLHKRPWEELVTSVATCDAQTNALWRVIFWKHWPFFFLFPAVAAPGGCSVA